jgi:hypothetical protein
VYDKKGAVKMKSTDNRRWSGLSFFVVTVLATLSYLVALGWSQELAAPVGPPPKLDTPTLSCVDATETSITVQVCGGATTGAPAGFSVQWVIGADTPFDDTNTCGASFSGVPADSNYDLGAGQCTTVVIPLPDLTQVGASTDTGNPGKACGEFFCGDIVLVRGFAHNAPQGLNTSDKSTPILCTTAQCSVTFQGCTPGYWKNHNNPTVWITYLSSQTVKSVFSAAGVAPYSTLGDKSLLQALSFKGGSTIPQAAEILLRAAVSAILNASNPSVNYPRSAADIIAEVNGALNSQTRDTILTLAAALDVDNNLGCPLN